MSNVALGKRELLDEVMAAEAGRRSESLLGVSRILVIGLAIAWSLFQLWTASPFPFMTGIGILNDTIQRSVHLAFATAIIFLAFPLSARSRRDGVPLYDWALLAVSVFCVLYVSLFYRDLITRPGSPTATDIIVSSIGVVGLLEAVRRALGKPMMIIAIICLVYIFAGPYMPELIAHKGASFSRAASHLWLTTEGVFGVALGVSTSFVFLYVLFGSMLTQAGGGNYLTRVSFALLGHFRGGPAKASVLASGLNGLISGSSTANVLTVGNVTIPLMKRVGYSPVKAGAIEVAAGSNGQIMPPVMGAAAFIMTEYLSMPYSELIRHAFLPAILAYLSLLYIVHIEAVKIGMKGLPRRHSPLAMKLINAGLTIAGLFIIFRAAQWVSEWLPAIFGAWATAVAGVLMAAIYLGLIWLSKPYPEGGAEVDANQLTQLPEVRPALLGGAFYILPIFVLVWCLMALEQSPALAAFYACAFLGLLIITQRPLLAFLHRRAPKGRFAEGFHDLWKSLELGARNMITVAIATACAGIIVGTVSLTGIGQVLADVVEALSFGSLVGALVLTAVFSLFLGMGLPTTANYIVVSTLMAPVIVALAGSHGLEVPLVAVHLFVFYFGIMADATPPVALAAYAASGISGADPLKTGVQGFIYEMRTAILPFVFIFNPELLLIGVSSPWHGVWIITSAVIACFAFASLTQRFWLTHNKLWETLAFALITFLLFRPDVLRNVFYPPFDVRPTSEIASITPTVKEGEALRLRMQVIEEDKSIERTYVMTIPKGAGPDRLTAVGLTTKATGERLQVTDIVPDSVAEKLRLDVANQNYVTGIEVRNHVPWKGWFAIPAFVLLGVVFITQRRRRERAS